MDLIHKSNKPENLKGIVATKKVFLLGLKKEINLFRLRDLL